MTNLIHLLQIHTEAPGSSYLTDSYYYIPVRSSTKKPPRSYQNHQDISDYPSFEDEDSGDGFVSTYYNNRGQNSPSSTDDNDGYTVTGEDASEQDQERFGVFFIGEHESFGGSEEHYEQVPYKESLYIAPNRNEDREADDAGTVNILFK